MAYNPYSDIQKVFNAKVGWNNATTDEERKRQNEIANAARKNLEAYGYSDVANQISASGADATAARKILEQYAPKKATTAPDSTTLTNNELITTNNNETRNKVNQLWGTQTGDRDMMTGKYNKLEDTAYSNPFESEEAKAILKQYDLKAMQGRENEKASGAASNGGNIDSFAAANALRQQAALINKGQMVALDAHNNKINNVKGILADLGVYLQNQDKGMQTTIGLQANEGQRLFENNLAEKATMAEVTGYVPNEWTIKNDATYSQFLNPDGTFKKEMENVDIQALINNTTDADTKKKLAVIRAKKMLGNYGEYGQYINQGDVAFMDGNQITEARRESEQNDATVRESLKAEVEVNNANNQNELDKIKVETEGQKDLLEFQANLSANGGTATLSEDGADVFKQTMKNINANIVSNYGEKYSLPDGYEIIQWNGGTDFSLNLPNGHIPHWWATQILKPIFTNESLSANDSYALAKKLGFSDDDITYVANAIK
jgi:hypothetical protein